jgi:hypothetical protein
VRKVLAGTLCATVATAPAVAFAATDEANSQKVNDVTGTTDAHGVRKDAKVKLHVAHLRALREQHQAKERRQQRRERRLARKQAAAAPAATTPAASGSTASPQLEAIASCESGGNPSAVDSSGTYRGKYQFDYGTWASVGGSGDPAAAPEAEQDMRAQMLLARSGSTPWPVCG